MRVPATTASGPVATTPARCPNRVRPTRTTHRCWTRKSGPDTDDAIKWGAWLNSGQGGVVSTRVPRSFADQMMRWDKLDGIGPARFSSPGQLDTLNRVMSGIEFH